MCTRFQIFLRQLCISCNRDVGGYIALRQSSITQQMMSTVVVRQNIQRVVCKRAAKGPTSIAYQRRSPGGSNVCLHPNFTSILSLKRTKYHLKEIEIVLPLNGRKTTVYASCGQSLSLLMYPPSLVLGEIERKEQWNLNIIEAFYFASTPTL